MPASTTGVIIVSQGQWFAEIAGVPLLQRMLLSGHKAGVRRWIVCVPHGGQMVHSSLATAPKLRHLTWQVYDATDTAAETLREALPHEDVLVVTMPVVFDHRLLLALQDAPAPTLGVTTALAATPADLVVHEGYVVANAAHGAPAYRSTGILRCAGSLLSQLLPEGLAAAAPHTLLLTRLMAQSRVHALDVSQRLWCVISEPLAASVSTAEGQLLRSLGRDGDSSVMRTFDRRLSQALTQRLMRTAITPNQITVLSASIGLVGALLLAQPSPVWPILGSLLFLLSTILDGCDGELARLTFQESEFGAKLDLIMDNVVHLFLFPCLALGLYRREYDTLYFILGGLTFGGILVSMAVYLPYLLQRQKMPHALVRVHEHLASRDFAYLLPVLALFDKLHWFLWAATLGSYTFAVAWCIVTSRARRQPPDAARQ